MPGTVYDQFLVDLSERLTFGMGGGAGGQTDIVVAAGCSACSSF
jgi:hypothetical protein